MNRRSFLRSLGVLAGALGAGALLPGDAQALPVAPDAAKDAAGQLEPAVATPEDIEAAQPENVQYYYRRRRRIFWRRRRVFIYRRRRVYWRRRFIRRRRYYRFY